MAKLSDFVLLGAIGIGGYLIYKWWKGGIFPNIGLPSIPDIVLPAIDIKAGDVVSNLSGVDVGKYSDLYKAGTGTQGYMYNKEGIVYIDKNETFPGINKDAPPYTEGSIGSDISKGYQIIQPKGSGKIKRIPAFEPSTTKKEITKYFTTKASTGAISQNQVVEKSKQLYSQLSRQAKGGMY